MADQLVHLSGVQKREVEAALGRELVPVSATGDLFRIPEAVAVRIGEFPPSPPKAEDSLAVKEAARATPVDVEALEKDETVEERVEPVDEESVEEEKGDPEVVFADGADEPER